MDSLPTQFELFAQSFCADLEKINERVNRLNHNNTQRQLNTENNYAPRPPSIPIPPHLQQNGRGISPRFRNRNGQTNPTSPREDKNSLSLSSRINTTAKIVKPKRMGSPRQFQW